MLFIGVCEQDQNKIEELHERILHYFMRIDKDFKILWMVDGQADKKVEKYADKMQIALIALDYPCGKEIGKQIYQRNPNCLICYYKSEKCDLEPVLESRPMAFYLWENERSTFDIKMQSLMDALFQSGRIFVYETKKTKYVIPLNDILYLQSNLKYVEIHTKQQDDRTIYGKLTEIETKIEEQGLGVHFLRIHKSYLVNVSQIEFLDKSQHMVIMSNGEELPISDAQYPKVIKWMLKS